TGDITSVKATLTPGNSTDTIQWSTLNARVATVNAEGVVTGVSSGTTFIRAQAYNGKIPGATEIVQVVVRDGVKGIALDSLEKSVTVGSSISLVPIFTPESAFDKGMTWTSSNPSVAKVELSGTSNGKVTGVAPGIALITGTANDGKFTVACLVTVKAKVTANDTKVTLKPTTKYLKLGKTFYITATVTGTSNKKVKWSTSKKSVATVTSDGKVKGKKVGTAYIKATAQDGSGAYARCKVRVVRMAKKIKLNKSTAKVLVGSTLKLKATITPKNATIKKVKWSSSKNSIATVSSSGRVLGVSPGIVKIKAKATDGSGKSATCILTVQEPVEATGVTVENGSITVAKGKAVQSGIVAAPANTTTKIKYYSDNKKVATVNKRGKIRTKRAGQATIYGETANGKIGYVDVLVVDLNRKGLVMRQYDTEQLHVNEISTGVTWYSKNINVATVDSTGKVTGRKKGTTTIYAVVNGVKLGCRVQIKKIK
ncbi:MAG: Ig-like domain-containing protein, partial [Eubacterium sp.]|nr:Ig-like domain-containing protein [Eubacterium sp.]